MKYSQKHVIGAITSFALAALASAAPMSDTAEAAEAAQATASVLKMEIMSNCQNGNAMFRIRNAGDAWPKTSNFAIYHMGKDGKTLIAKRAMRLKDGQRASFKVNTEKYPDGQLGLWVEPGWYKREFAYDATVNCG
jgi:hypothetical protein